jgi:hypothetical protein
VVSSSASHGATGRLTRSDRLPGIDGGAGKRGFSTIVENPVEISGLSQLAVVKSLVLPESAYGEGRLMAIFSILSGS